MITGTSGEFLVFSFELSPTHPKKNGGPELKTKNSKLRCEVREAHERGGQY